MHTHKVSDQQSLLYWFTRLISHCTVVHSCIYITNPLPDPPRVSLMTNQLQIEKGQNVTVHFVIVGSDNQSARYDFEMELTETGMYVQ